VVLKPGAHLSSDQILGIQRLVAAAVPGLDASQVTITDQRGIALSTEVDADASGAPATGKLRLKKQADEYLTRKVSEVLDRAFGPGQAIVSVDATLNFDEIRRTDQSIVPIRGHGDEVGAVVRRRESIYRQPSGAGAGAVAAVKTTDTTGDRPAEAATAPGTLTSTNEVEYELSKSGEQVLSTPGGIRRISVGVIVPQSLTDDQLARIRDIVGMAVGFNPDRGDAISIEPLSRIMTKPTVSPAPATANTAADAPPAVTTERPVKKEWWPGDTVTRTALFAGVLLLVGFVIAIATRRAEQNTLERRLSARERQQLLTELKSWLETEKATAGGAPNR
jgi:flagellar M-ring protein FliF